jgi:hypothetical protein
MMRSYSGKWNDPGDWRLEEALWAHWCHDYEKCFALLTRVCLAEVVEDDEHEQTQQAVY